MDDLICFQIFFKYSKCYQCQRLWHIFWWKNTDFLDGTREETVENSQQDGGGSALYDFLYPNKELLPDDKEMSIFDHLEELRQRIFVSVLAVGASILGCFAFSKELIMILEAPVKTQGVRFLQLAPGEFFFTTLKVRLLQNTLLLASSFLSSLVTCDYVFSGA